MRILSYCVLILIAVYGLYSCADHRHNDIFDRAESMMESHPDSALALLESIDRDKIGNKKDKARYALLMSMALDKNFVDTTSFDVLQPAIDYYLSGKDTKEKLRTYYYKGVIHLNRGEKDSAWQSIYRGLELLPASKDSLYIARMLSLKGYFHFEMWEFDKFSDYNLTAYKIFKKYSCKSQEFNCLLSAFGGALATENKELADSLVPLLKSYHGLDSIDQSMLYANLLQYTIDYDSIPAVRKSLEEGEKYPCLPEKAELTRVLAYSKIGEADKGMSIIDSIRRIGINDSMQYGAILIDVLQGQGKYKEALEAQEYYFHLLGKKEGKKFEEKVYTIENTHTLEGALKRKDERNRQITIYWFSGSIILILILILIYMRYRIVKNKKRLVEARALSLDLLVSQKEAEKENLNERLKLLEGERDNLKMILSSKVAFPVELKKTIYDRLHLLNELLNESLIEDNNIAEANSKRISKFIEDPEIYMEYNREVIAAAYPWFMDYLEKRGLDKEEIKYVCLYASGLNGKQIGKFLRKGGHTNLSSRIGQKLGVRDAKTTLRSFVVKLLREEESR